MSGGAACQCSEKAEPIAAAPGSNRPGRLWRVIQRLCNHSAFNGYHRTFSLYSSLICLRCGAVWRTKAGYVAQLRDQVDGEKFISCGYKGHREAMEARGRTPHDNHAGG